LPGVGHYGFCLRQFRDAGYVDPVRKYINSGKPFMGICVGLQALFEGSAESPSVPGLGIIKGVLERFDDSNKSVPHIGWNSANTQSSDPDSPQESIYGLRPGSKYYYVHSYAVPYREGELEKDGWKVATARYGSEVFVGAVAKDNVLATQFHPEKSGAAGQRVLKAFLDGNYRTSLDASQVADDVQDGLTRRIIACLDVRTNDQGDLVVTKGDQYDVREKSDKSVRNLGKPVEKAQQYYQQGADEVTFLNITSFRDTPLRDLPMLEVLRQASATVFVPLTIGGGIRDTYDPATQRRVPALEVATLYFKSGRFISNVASSETAAHHGPRFLGADKVSIGSDAVTAAEQYYASNKTLTGKTAIETISEAYGAQAVVVSVDPKRVYVKSHGSTSHHTLRTQFPGPNGEQYCWYACTIKGGRETRDIDVVQLVTAVQDMGAGEILLNCIDKDGTNSGFDLELIKMVKAAVKIPVIASSGAGNADHFAEVFEWTTVDAALGAGKFSWMAYCRRHLLISFPGMFHRGEWTVKQVKDQLRRDGLMVRKYEAEV
jgi:glutamine amidotransferase/cyclase